MKKESLAYCMYNVWADTFFGEHSMRWEDLRPHEIQRWYQTAEELIPAIKYLEKEAIENEAREAKYKAQQERAKAKAKERRIAAKARRQA